MFTTKRKLIISVIAIYITAFIGIDVLLAESRNTSSKPLSTINIDISTIKHKSLQKINQQYDISTPKVLVHVFKHGDISWLPDLATQAGWPKETWPKLGQIILRESGGCPNRFGGSIVDKNCNITGHDGSNHRSDSGLLQINGVHYKTKNSGLCKTLGICSQVQLLDAVTNLKAGKALYDAVGWAPWDPCYWGPKYAKRCKAMKGN